MDEYLIALRNYLVQKVAALPPMVGYKCYRFHAFNECLDKLDPDAPCALQDPMLAYEAFDGARRLIDDIEFAVR